jgi:YfiH family protein
MPDLFLESTALAALPAMRHGFFTRRGGVSEGPFDSLNAGFSGGDDPERVMENRARALAALDLDPASIATARQIHGRDVITATAPNPGRSQRAADALVTDRPGVTLGILTADCAPVVLADPVAGVVGAAHAGWRGALVGVLEATIDDMVGLGAEPSRMIAAIGPCIARRSYEVGPELHADFMAADPASDVHFARVEGSDRLLFDLEGYVCRRLSRAGVLLVDPLGADTLGDPDRFFSSRRTRKSGGERFGLLLTVVALG